MFKRILVGVDGREGGGDAIVLAARLLEQDGHLTLANVYPGESYVWRGGNPAYSSAMQEDALSLLSKARDAAGVAAELRSVGSPSIGQGLHSLAEEIDADLIVVGSSRRGVLGRVLLSDDTRSALDAAVCAIAIAPAGYAQHPSLMGEIGVGYNGSPESEHALHVARELATWHGAKLSAFEAVSLPTNIYLAGALPAYEVAEEMVDEARTRLEAIGGVIPHAAYGIPAEELAVYSASLDLLVVGSRGYGPVGRLIHGSTCRALARSARCPLIVLPKVVLPSTSAASEKSEKLAVEA